jgi:CO/xanthine dehydrogenase Mo-binding subunit
MSGGAVRAACVAVAEKVRARVADELCLPDDARMRLAFHDGRVRGVALDAGVSVELADLLTGGPVAAEATFRPRPTVALDETGQGDPHVAFAVVAHRAVVDVDLDLGLVRVVHMALAQDVGRVLNPLALRGQVEGGTAQGIGHALMEELVVEDGAVRNASFHDYLLPTAADVPPLDFVAVEVPHPDAPYGAKGAGEAPVVTAAPAIVAAVRAATGRELTRIPVRPEDVVL